MITKTEVCKMIWRVKERDIESSRTYWNFTLVINSLIFNCVLKGIIPYDVLTLREKKSLNNILEGNNKRLCFCGKRKQLVCRSGKK